jgi:hypothetical protein
MFNPENCEKLVGNLLNLVTVKLKISMRHFQWYKEHMKWEFESIVMDKL